MNNKIYYTSITDLPIWNWWQITKTGNLVYLFRKVSYDKEVYNLVSLWTDLHNQFLDKYGLSDSMKSVLKLKKKWIEKQANYIETGDRFNLTEIDMINAELNENMTNKSSMSNEESIIYLEEKLGRELNPKNLSVSKYNDYINYYSKQK